MISTINHLDMFTNESPNSIAYGCKCAAHSAKRLKLHASGKRWQTSSSYAEALYIGIDMVFCSNSSYKLLQNPLFWYKCPYLSPIPIRGGAFDQIQWRSRPSIYENKGKWPYISQIYAIICQNSMNLACKPSNLDCFNGTCVTQWTLWSVL